MQRGKHKHVERKHIREVLHQGLLGNLSSDNMFSNQLTSKDKAVWEWGNKVCRALQSQIDAIIKISRYQYVTACSADMRHLN